MKTKQVFVLILFLLSSLFLIHLGVFSAEQIRLLNTDSMEEAATIKAGLYTGSLGEIRSDEKKDNEDYYQIEVEEGQIVSLKLTVPGNANFNLTLFNPGKNSRGSSVTEKEHKFLEYIADSTGIWTVRISRSSGEGEYLLSVEVKNQNDGESGKDAGKTTEGSIPIFPSTITGFLKAGDNEDYYSIEVEEGQIIRLKMAIPGNANFNVTLFNPNRNSRGTSSTQGDFKILNYVADSTGIWFIKISRSSGEGEYQLAVELENQNDAGSGQDAGDSNEKAISLSTGVYQGFLKAGDNTDYYSIHLQDGQSISLRLAIPGNANFGITLFDPGHNSRGSSLAEGDSKTLEYMVNSTGIWFIRINRTSGEGEYQLNINLNTIITEGTTGETNLDDSIAREEAEEKDKEAEQRGFRESESLVAQFTYQLVDSEDKNHFFFDSSTSYGPSPIAEYEWDFGDGSSLETGKQVEHKFEIPGIYLVTLTVVDENGERAKEIKEIDTTLLLTASFMFFPEEPGILETVKFDASSSYSPVSIETYQWNFGDGREEVFGINVEHSFSAPGSYSVQLMITDNFGETSISSHEVNVLAIDEDAFIQCGVIQASNHQRIPFRSSFPGQPIVLTSAVMGDGNVLLSTPINITDGFFDIAINNFQGDPVSNALVHWIAFIPDSARGCLGGIAHTGGQANIYIPFTEPLNVRENEQIIVLTNAEKNRAYLSRIAQIDEQGSQIWVTDQDGNPVSANVYWMAVVPNDLNGFQGSQETLSHGDTIIFENPFVNQAACVCSSSTQNVLSAASNSDQNQFVINISADQANVNWLAFGGAVPPIQPGQIQISSNPSGATVYLNETNVGITLADVILEISDLFPGTYALRIELANYNAFVTEVTVSPDEVVIINPNLHFTSGKIIIGSEPSGAIIRIDDSPNYPFYWDNEQGWVSPEYGITGITPVNLYPIPPGEHAITLELDNYAIWSETVNLEPGGIQNIQAVLEPDPGVISVTSTQSGATIYLAEGDWTQQPDSEEIVWIEKGMTPTTDIYGTPVPLVLENIVAGTYTIKCVSEYYQEIIQKIEVDSNMIAAVHFELIPALAYVKIIAQDELGIPVSGAYTSFSPCFGTGCSQGPTNDDGISKGSLNAGSYNVTVWRQNYQTFTREIHLTDSYPSENPLTIQVTLIGNPGTIQVTSNPPGAIIYLAAGEQNDDSDSSVWEELGLTPQSITGLSQGDYTLKTFLEGYTPVELSDDIMIPSEGYADFNTFSLNPGETKNVNIQFKQMTGNLLVSSNESNPEVFLNNQSLGFLLTENGINSRLFEDIPIGTYHLTVSKENYLPYQENVEILYQDTTNTQANLYLSQFLTAYITMTPSFGQPPLEVNFTGEGSGPAGTNIESYHWDFGDGNSSSEQNPTHIFQEAGQYNITLTVTDQQGDMASKDLYVNVISGDQLIVNPASGCLTISADGAMVETGSMTYSGNVLLNGFLEITDSVTVQDGENGEIFGNGDLSTGIDFIDSAMAGINTEKSFTIEPKEYDIGGCYREISFMDSVSNFSFTYYGLNFEAADPKLYTDRLSFNGTVSFFSTLLPTVGLGLSVDQSGFDFGTRIELPELSIQGFGIEDAYLELDLGCGNCWGAGITFGLPPSVGIKVGGTLGILNGNVNKVSAKAASLGLPIGNTGVFLGSIDGGLEHIPPDPEPLVLKAGAGFYAGPKITIPPINLLDGALEVSGGELHLLGGDVDLIFDCSGKMTAEGIAYILDKNFGEIGSAELLVDLNRGFYAKGELRYPPGSFALLKGTLASKLDFDLEFQASIAGILQVPEALPIIGGMHFGEAAGYIDNDLIAAGVSIGDEVCLPVVGCYDFTFPVCLIFSFDDPGFEVVTNWDAIQEVSLTQLPLPYISQMPLQFAGVGLPLFSLAQAGRNPTIEKVFEVPEGLEVAIFHMNISPGGILPEFRVTSPNDLVYEQERDSAIWHGNETTGDLWCAVSNPLPGRWVVASDMLLSDLEYKITLYKLNQKPTIELTTPINEIITEVGTQIPINWKAEDPDNDAMIRLCYTESPLLLEKTNLPAFPGNTIVKNISEDNSKNTHIWDTKGVAPGNYYVYAVIFDGKNFPVYSWSKGSVTITDSKFIPPKGVNAYQDSSVIRVEWNSMPDAIGYHVYYQDIQDQTPLILSPSLAIWEENETEIRHLQSGKTYRIAVTAFREDGYESYHSKPIEVSYR